ncbi:SusE domain-containing protein [Viscerimonas tarda]
MIKNFFKLTLFTCLISLCSCDEEETNRVEYPDFQHPMSVTASQSNLVLEEDKADQTAITFTWTEGNNRGSGTSLKYVVNLGLQLESGVRELPAIEIPDGQHSLSYTHEELNELLLAKWNVSPEIQENINIKVTARIIGGSLAQLPEVAETTVKATAYAVSEKPKPGEKPYETVCLAGSCIADGYNMSTIPRMNWNPSIPNLYTIDKIHLTAASILFVLDPDAGYDNSRMFQAPVSTKPQLADGIPQPMVLTPGKAPEWKWNVAVEGDYKVVVDVEAITVTIHKL